MRFVYGYIIRNQCDAVFLLFHALHGGLVAIDQDDGDVSAIYVIYCKNSL